MNKTYTRIIYSVKILFLIVLISLGTGCGEGQKASAVSEIHFIDTGNSDAILVIEGNQAAVIDGGDNDDENWLPDYIKAQGVEKLKYLFVTHPDADHIGGLDAIISEIPIENIYVGNGKAETKTYRDFIEAMMDKGLTPSVPLLGSTFELGNASFKVLSVAHSKDVNHTSLVLFYTNGKDKILFMGDADKEIEKTIDVQSADLIKVGHHGSRTSSDKTFLKKVNPQYAVITSGKGNKYNHPHQETLETLSELGIAIYRTDEMGHIVFVSTGEGVTPKKQGAAEQSESRQKVQEAKASAKTAEQVFFTENGKKYHKVPACSGMKSPIEGTIEDAGSRMPCEKCY